MKYESKTTLHLGTIIRPDRVNGVEYGDLFTQYATWKPLLCCEDIQYDDEQLLKEA